MATFGRYEILDKLGEGAMGVVYRARDPALNRIVALKMLSAELGGEEEIHQRFQREAEAIGRLSHSTIVTVYDLGQAEGQLYMAMELLEGDDLRKLMERRVDIPLADRVRIMLGIAEGLGGIPALAAVFAVLTGLVGALSAKYLFDALRIREPEVRGFALGTASHGIGAARALQVHPDAGAYAGLALGMQVLLATLVMAVVGWWV